MSPRRASASRKRAVSTRRSRTTEPRPGSRPSWPEWRSPRAEGSDLTPEFGVFDHVSLSVTNLDRSHRFYTGVLGMEAFMDFGHARLYVHRTGFLLALVQHEEGSDKPFSELNTGLDHISFTVAREDLPRWEQRFDEMDVVYTPTRDMEFGSHLNFRDPDNIPFEFFAPLPQVQTALQAVVSGEMAAEGLTELARQQVADRA